MLCSLAIPTTNPTLPLNAAIAAPQVIRETDTLAAYQKTAHWPNLANQSFARTNDNAQLAE
jgi:hypothetical protein